MLLQENPRPYIPESQPLTLKTSEARMMLRAALGPYCQAGYEQLQDMTGHSTSFDTTGPSGARYRVDCFVNQVSPSDRMITVAGIATELAASSRIPEETSLGFSILADGTIF